MRKISLLLCSILTSIVCAFGQLKTAPNGESDLFSNAQGGSPMLNLIFSELRTKQTKTFETHKEEIIGSPYLNSKFIKCKVFYNNDLVGNFYLRYSALNSQLEIKQNINDEKVSRIKADKNILVQYKTRDHRFSTFITKKKHPKNGYLSMIATGKQYSLYHRSTIKFVEGKAAQNSMVNPIPSLYAPFEEYYLKTDGINRINQAKNQHKEALKLYFKHGYIDLKKEEDLIKSLNYLNYV